MAKNLTIADLTLTEKMSATDDDVAQLFQDDKQPLKSPTDRDKRSKERVEAEESYLNVSRHFTCHELFSAFFKEAFTFVCQSLFMYFLLLTYCICVKFIIFICVE
jgi:hypothetical protein